MFQSAHTTDVQLFPGLVHVKNAIMDIIYSINVVFLGVQTLKFALFLMNGDGAKNVSKDTTFINQDVVLKIAARLLLKAALGLMFMETVLTAIKDGV